MCPSLRSIIWRIILALNSPRSSQVTAAKLDTYQVVRNGEGREVDRYPGYHFEDLAWRYSGKIMQPLLVVLDPTDEPAKLVTHTGQEFNLVLEGTVVVTWADKEFELTPATASTSIPSIRTGSAAVAMCPPSS